MTHDLRTQLTAMKAAVDLIRQGTPAGSDSSARSVAILARQVTRMDRLLGDLMDSVRVESGQFEVRKAPTRLDLLTREVLDLFEAAPETALSAEIEPDVWAEVDPLRWRQVLVNLISNAVKYSPTGSPVKIEVHNRDGDAVTAVSDRGVGIAPEEVPRIFEPFDRATAMPQGIAGAGLGLSVVKRLVEAHGGRIEVTSEVGKGSVFRAVVPACPAPRTEPGGESQGRLASAGEGS